MRAWHTAVLAVTLLAGCPQGDDDDSAPVDDDDVGQDDDDATAVEPLADLIGLFNLTNVVRAEGVSYIDFSGAFGTFIAEPDQPLAPAAYLETWSYGADAPFWRFDLGGFPLPDEGESAVVNPATWISWTPADQTWWDGGQRAGLGNYLATRLDFEDVVAYQVDDPIVPGAAAWTPGATLTWENAGGAHVVGFAAEAAVALPERVILLEPTEGATTPAASALPLTVRWTPNDDGSFVTVGVVQNLNSPTYIARVADTGEHTIPADYLHDQLGAGLAQVVLGRNIDTVLPHPQGDLIVRTREERRATVDLLPDVVLSPAFGQPGASLDIEVSWFTGTFEGATADLGDGITVTALTPDPADEHRATLSVDIALDAALGSRELVLVGVESITWPAAFSVVDLVPSDTCEDAAAAGPLEPGSFTSSTAGSTDDLRSYACLPWSLAGPDAVWEVELGAGEALDLVLEAPAPVDGALLVLADCGDALSTVACADDGLEGDPEVLSYHAEEAGTVYVVVDGYYFAEKATAFGGPFTLTLEAGLPPLEPGWLLAGDGDTFTLRGDQPWGAVLASDVDFGTGVVVEAVSGGALPTELAVLATSSPSATAGPRTVTVNDPGLGLVSFPDALHITDWPAFDACADAVGDATPPGSGTAFAPGASSDYDVVPCLPYDSYGADVVYPLDLLAGEVLDATVQGPDDLQIYLLADCGDPESCFDDAAADDTIEGQAESIVAWTVPADGRYYLVVDLFGSLVDPTTPWSFTLDITVQ